MAARRMEIRRMKGGGSALSCARTRPCRVVGACILLLAAYFKPAAAFTLHAAGNTCGWGLKSALCLRPRTCSARVRMSAEGENSAVAAQRKAARDAFVDAARAGPKNGVDATAEQRADIEGKLAELIKYNPTKEPAVQVLRPPFQYIDGTFSLLYTNTTGGASGKLGPWVGDVSQTFEGMRDPEPIGVSGSGALLQQAAQFGPLKTSLQVRCETRTETKLDLVFEEFGVSIFGFKVQQPIMQRGKGTRWTLELTYMDYDLRVLRTNRGNVLALEKVEPLGGKSYMDSQKRIIA